MTNPHLAIALDDAGRHPAAALELSADELDRTTSAAWWEQVIGEADRNQIAFVTIADRPGAGDAVPLSPRLDALMIATRVAPHTHCVGLMPSVNTTLTEPFLTSSQLATLDWVSGGRAGWEVEISRDPADALYVGPRPVPAPAERDAEAAEVVEVVRALWDSWDDDAEIRDLATHRFVDRTRLHHIGHEGRYLSVRGPSITPRPPQGQVPVAVRVLDRDDISVAAAHGDLAFVAVPSLDELPGRLTALARAGGSRRPAALVFVELAVVLDAGEASARRRRDRLDERAGGPPAWPGLTYVGTPRGLADWLLELSDLGVDGVRLHPAALPHDLFGITRELLTHLADGPAAPGASLRHRLGLERPSNRFAPAA